MRVLVLSDTHGLLRPEVAALLPTADAVLHAGDVGSAAVLSELRGLAGGPFYAVRGNVDKTPPTADLPATWLFEAEGRSIYLLHRLEDLDLSPKAAGIDAVIYGHSHRPEAHWEGGVLYLNPGSVGPRRFSLPVTCAWLELPSLQVAPIDLIEDA